MGLFDEVLHMSYRCPLCGARYSMQEAQEIEGREDSTMVYIECARCGSSIVALVAMSGVGVVALGLVTDMTQEDVERFRRARPISSDDLLDVVAALKEKPNRVIHTLTAPSSSR
jgi:DNA-directed RNA polymerase subunit RPC12/RpoP